MSNEKLSVPYFVHEGELARQERHIKRLLVILAIMLALFTLSNLAWLYVWNQYEYIDETETTTTTIDAQQDGEGVNIVGGEDVSYGSDSNNNEKEEKDTSKTEEEKR